MKLRKARELFGSAKTLAHLMMQAAGLEKLGIPYIRKKTVARPCVLCKTALTEHPNGFCSVECRQMYKMADNIARRVGKSYINYLSVSSGPA